MPNAIGRRAVLAGIAAASAAPFSARGADASFHGFDPLTFDGKMLPADDLHAMVTQAMAHTKPHQGAGYVMGFANLQRDISFCVKVEQGLRDNAKAAGIELIVADNRLDGATALNNAESFLQRGVDYVFEFQTDANFGAAIMRKMNDAGTNVTAIDIPMPGATFFGANNPRSGFMGGAYLAQAAAAKFGADELAGGFLVVGNLPQSGAIPAMRTGGQIAGFLAVANGFPADHIIKIDTKNTLEESFAQMTNVLPRIPKGVPIMVTAINDQSVNGMLRAVTQAGRQADAIAVGMGADEAASLAATPEFAASVGYFPERYGNYLVPLALMQLAGLPTPPAVLVHHVMVTKGTLCTFYPDQPCAKGAEIDFKFPDAAFAQHLASLRADPSLKDFSNLIPAS